MWQKLFRIRASTWALLASVAIVSIGSLLLRAAGTVSAPVYLYVLQPIGALIVAGITYALAAGRKDRVRHTSEKAFTVAAVVAIWFVVYFLSGLAVTYVNNAVVSGWVSVLQNIVAYGIVAVSFEYARHGVMSLAGRRNIIWFGSLVSIVFAAQQMNLAGLIDRHTVEDFLKLFVSDLAPVIITSFLLTYLAVTAGFKSQLVYRLGLIAMAVVPPIIPKYDWYLMGASSIILTVAVYLVMDRSNRSSERERMPHHRHPRFAFDIMFVVVMIALVLFMTGAFNYKPMVIMSNSMVPVYARGSVVVAQKISDPVDIHKGDILQYQAGNIMITHRVVMINTASDGSGERVFTTKGDNNSSPDPLVRQSQVVGIVRAQIPYVGYPTVFLHDISQGNR